MTKRKTNEEKKTCPKSISGKFSHKSMVSFAWFLYILLAHINIKEDTPNV